MLAQIDEEGDMKNAVGMEMAKVNAVIAKKLPQERMLRNPKSMNEIKPRIQLVRWYRGLGTVHLQRGAILRLLDLEGCLQTTFLLGSPG